MQSSSVEPSPPSGEMPNQRSMKSMSNLPKLGNGDATDAALGVARVGLPSPREARATGGPAAIRMEEPSIEAWPIRLATNAIPRLRGARFQIWGADVASHFSAL